MSKIIKAIVLARTAYRVTRTVLPFVPVVTGAVTTVHLANKIRKHVRKNTAG